MRSAKSGGPYGRTRSSESGDAADEMNDFNELLGLRPTGVDEFAAIPAGHGTLYGGYALALALRAAASTVRAELRPDSLHAYFIDRGVAAEPLAMKVRRLRDGRSMATREVTVSQRGGVPLRLVAAFHLGEEGPDWQPSQSLSCPPPEALLADSTRLRSIDPMEIRPVGGPRDWTKRQPLAPLHPYWAKLRHPLPDDPVLHACAVLFISDYLVIGAAQSPGAPAPTDSTAVTLDHAMWFHREATADDWLLFTAGPKSVAAGRGLCSGSVHTRDGQLLASFSQEVLTRKRRAAL